MKIFYFNKGTKKWDENERWEERKQEKKSSRLDCILTESFIYKGVMQLIEYKISPGLTGLAKV